MNRITAALSGLVVLTGAGLAVLLGAQGAPAAPAAPAPAVSTVTPAASGFSACITGVGAVDPLCMARLPR